MKSILTYLMIYMLAQVSGQPNVIEVRESAFSLLDSSIITRRGLEKKIAFIKDNCDWSGRVGKKVDVFWLRTSGGDYFGHVFEYFMDCDNVRLIYWYADPGGSGEVLDFMIEDLEDDSQFVSSKKKHLKNIKKYQNYLSD